VTILYPKDENAIKIDFQRRDLHEVILTEDSTFGLVSKKVIANQSASENIGDESMNTMVNTPLAFDSGAKLVSSLIRPLKREKYRNQIMPSEIDMPADFITPYKK
jgi:hypothetical protein